MHFPTDLDKVRIGGCPLYILILYLIEMPFNAFANRADPDQAALVRAASSGSALFAYGNMISLILHKWT